MKVYIRNVHEAERHFLAEVASTADAEQLVHDVSRWGCYMAGGDVEEEAVGQFLLDAPDVGFEVIVGTP